jgi:hypothetical protein
MRTTSLRVPAALALLALLSAPALAAPKTPLEVTYYYLPG